MNDVTDGDVASRHTPQARAQVAHPGDSEGSTPYPENTLRGPLILWRGKLCL